MTKHRGAHEYLTWAKQKIDEIDATLAALDDSADALKKDAREQADRAIARVRVGRDALEAKVDALKSDAAAAKAVADDAYLAIERELAEIESAFRDFLAAAEGQANLVEETLTARIEAQRLSWQTSLRAAQASVSATIDQALAESDSALRRLATETKKAEATLGRASAAGDESWKAIKSGVEEVVSAYGRTWKQIADAVSKIR